jgi:uncharacterized alpha-E superfamily protein
MCAMLSRIAESLFWIGRYVERAEDTARILDVHLHLLLEDPWVDEDAACRSLLAVMGMPSPPGADDPPGADEPADRMPGVLGPAPRLVGAARVLDLLGFDDDSSSSVVGALSAARENARGARETVSSEMWECLNVTWHTLPEVRRTSERLGMHSFFRWVRERCSVMAGLTDATMSRDEGWLFLVLGRSLERVDMTARLLSMHVRAGGSVPSWLTLLRSCGAWETYVRTYRGGLEDRDAAEFLLLDRLFPRSVFHALSTAESCLDGLETGSGLPAGSRAGVVDEARRIVGRTRTYLEFRRADELLADLPAVLGGLHAACSSVSDAVSRRYFRHTAAVTWAHEAVS